MDLNKDATGRSTGLNVLRKRWPELACAILSFLMALNYFLVIPQKSLTIDETVMIPAGFYHLTARDFRPINEHPPFAKVIAAAPLLFTAAVAPPLEAGVTHDYNYFLGRFDTFWTDNREIYETLTFWSRVPAVITTLLLGLFLFIYARRLFGSLAAVFALFLFTVEPTVLAHGRVVQTDIPSALGFLLASFSLYEYVRSPSFYRAMLVGLVVGFAVVTKFSMIILGPLTGLAVCVLFVFAPRLGVRRKSIVAHMIAMAVICVLVVNAAYFFNSRPPEPYTLSLQHFGYSATTDNLLQPALKLVHSVLHHIFPADFVEGIGWQLGHNQYGHPSGLMGRYSITGWWFYFPVAFSLKTSLPFLIVALTSVVWALCVYAMKREAKFLAVLVPLAVFTGVVMMSKINIGVRYFLPAYIFLFILAGGFLSWLVTTLKSRSLAIALPGVLLCWAGLEALWAYPHYMAHMNQLASSRPRWYYLSDSNVEWGDEIRELADYLHARGETRAGAALLNGQVLWRYGIDGVSIFTRPDVEPEPTRYVAVGASFLNGSTVPGEADGVKLKEHERVNYFDRYRHLQPEVIIGNSIYVYRMRD